MDESDLHPACDERGLALDDGSQQLKIGPLVALGMRIMTLDHIIGEQPDRFDVAARGEVLKRAYTHETRGHPRQYRSRQRLCPQNRLAGGDRSESARRRYAERVHR